VSPRSAADRPFDDNPHQPEIPEKGRGLTLREQVERRASRRCEYCQAPQDICAYTFHLEHITPRSKGGEETLANYGLSCFFCNSSKGDHTTGIDAETGREEPLFHPRRQKWNEHFEWTRNHTVVIGKTPIGRGTVNRLRMNNAARLAARPLWIETGTWP
jgi:hypothetical protein